MIAVDWGTSRCRAYRLTGERVVDRRQTDLGITRIAPGGFPAALQTLVAGWLDAGEDRVLMAGMVGSRQGWVEAAYVPCPAGEEDLADATIGVPFDAACVRLVPGVSARDASGVPDVMRGEEVQILGAGVGTGWVCLPGTHSKWARVDGGRITGFSTHLTGETFAALRDHTILGRAMQSPALDDEAFEAGVARSFEPGGLLHHVFGVRTLGLMGRLPDAGAASYLSGVLVGHEVRAALPAGERVQVVGAPPLAALYARAIVACGGSAQIGDEEAAAVGLARLAARVSWT